MFFILTTVITFPPAPLTHGGMYLPKREYTFFVGDEAHLSPGKVIGVIALGEHSVLECGGNEYKSPLYTSSHVTVKLDGNTLVLHAGPDQVPAYNSSGREMEENDDDQELSV